jgi:VWFA-related protein
MKNLLSILPTLAAICLACTVPAYAQDKADEVIKIDTSLVNIPVIVSDRENRYIPGLTIADFKVFQDGSEQRIEVFNNEEAPMSIVLALDTSRSTELVLDKIKKAAKQFVKVLAPGDRAMIVTFDNDVEILSPLTNDKKVLQKAVKDAGIGERFGTLIHDAVYQVVNRTLKPVKGRKAIILLTDGKDFGSYITRRELLAELDESDTVIYPVFYETENFRPRRDRDRAPFPGRRGGGIGRRGRGGMGWPGGGGIGRPDGQRRGGGGRGIPGGGNRPDAEKENELASEFLQQLADTTSGRFFREKIADLPDVFRQIADEMKRQYLIGYYPGEEPVAAGTVHRIKVQVERRNTVVRSKTTYRTSTR